MAIIDLDEYAEKKEPVGFKLHGKKHIVPDMTMEKVIEFNRLRNELRDKKDEDLDGIFENQRKSIALAIPSITEEDLLKTTSSQMRKIQDLVNRVFLGQDETDIELEFYRNKYNDEFRKNVIRSVEKKKE